MYALATVEADGQIRVTDKVLVCRWCGKTEQHGLGCGSDATFTRVVHKESVAIHAWGSTCYSQLYVAKEAWPGPDSDTVVIALDDRTGACTAIWMADAQRDTLVPRLNKWKGCYGAWPIRKLNA